MQTNIKLNPFLCWLYFDPTVNGELYLYSRVERLRCLEIEGSLKVCLRAINILCWTERQNYCQGLVHTDTHGHRRNTERLNDVSSHKKLTLELMHSFHEQTPLAFEWYPWLIIQKPELFISSAPNSLLKHHSLRIYRWIWRGFSGGTFSGIKPLRIRLLTNTKHWDQTTKRLKSFFDVNGKMSTKTSATALLSYWNYLNSWGKMEVVRCNP